MNLPPYHIFPQISGQKISLRKIQPADLEQLLEISYYDAVQATNLSQAADMLEKIDQDYQDGNSIHWGIVENLTNLIVGTCGYYRGLDKGEGELGCILLSAYEGKGFMTAALDLAIDFGLNEIGLKRVWAITDTDNNRAKTLLDRLNFVKVNDLEDNSAEYELKKK